MSLTGIRLGFALTGSFCTFEKAFKACEELVGAGAEVYPIMSFNAAGISSRFGRAEDNIKRFEDICGHEVIKTIEAAEPIGPKKMFDILAVAPCTSNTAAKLVCGITDTPVNTKMIVKFQLNICIYRRQLSLWATAVFCCLGV